jgi:DNA-binding NarL/FixJ family response regulator
MSFETIISDRTTRAILVVHREPVVRLGLVAALAESEFNSSVYACTPQGEAFYEYVGQASVVITDYRHGIEMCTRFHEPNRSRRPSRSSVMVVTTREGEHDVRAAIDAGVKGYLLAGFEIAEFTHSVRTLMQGSRYLCSAAAHKLVDSMSHEVLTARELEVLKCIVDGKVNKRIGSELNIALGTVKAHVKSIFNKFDVATRTQAATLATRRGLLLSECESDILGGEDLELKRTASSSQFTTERAKSAKPRSSPSRQTLSPAHATGH